MHVARSVSQKDSAMKTTVGIRIFVPQRGSSDMPEFLFHQMFHATRHRSGLTNWSGVVATQLALTLQVWRHGFIRVYQFCRFHREFCLSLKKQRA